MYNRLLNQINSAISKQQCEEIRASINDAHLFGLVVTVDAQELLQILTAKHNELA